MTTFDTVVIPNAPILAGLSFRRFRDASDYVQMAAVHAGSQAWDQVDPLSARESVPTAEDLASSFPEDEAHGNADLLFAQIDDQIVGYNHVYWRWTEETGVRVYLHLGYLLPEWREKGIGSALLKWSQTRIREIVDEEHHEGPKTFATNVSSTEREADQLIQHDGYTAVRRLSDMVLAPLTASPFYSLPPKVTVRPIAPEHYREIYRAWKDAFTGIWTSTPESEEDYQDFLDTNINLPSFTPILCHIAWSHNQVVGLALSRISMGIGTISEVAVRKEWQRRGVARALLSQTLNALHEQRILQVRLFTDAANGQGARGLYEQFGFREVKQHIFYRKPIDNV